MAKMEMNYTVLLKSYKAVQEQLGRIPRVIGVGSGLKRVRGKLMDDIVYTVYVEEKRPESKLPSGEIIPSKISGFRTDVLPYIRPEPMSRPVDGDVQAKDTKGR